MKTKALLFLCLFLGIGLTKLSAQMKVEKTSWVEHASGIYMECTGDYLAGDITIENFGMAKNFVYRFRNVTLVGYIDEACTIPSGRVYESSETFTGGSGDMENTAKFSLNGKNIGNLKFLWHTTTNANGEVKVDNFRLYFICH